MYQVVSIHYIFSKAFHYMHYECFPPTMAFFSWCLWRAVFHLHEIQFICFLSFIKISTSGVLRNLCLHPRSWRYSHVFSVPFGLDFMFTFIHLGISFCIWCKVRVEIFFFPYDIWLFKDHFLKKTLFSLLYYFGSFVENQWTFKVWVCFCTPSSVPVVCLFFFYANTYIVLITVPLW